MYDTVSPKIIPFLEANNLLNPEGINLWVSTVGEIKSFDQAVCIPHSLNCKAVLCAARSPAQRLHWEKS